MQPYPCFGVNGLDCGTDDDRMKVLIAFFESIQHEPGSAHSGTGCRVGEVHSTVWRRPILSLRPASRQLDGLAVRLCFRHGPAGCPAGWAATADRALKTLQEHGGDPDGRLGRPRTAFEIAATAADVAIGLLPFSNALSLKPP